MEDNENTGIVFAAIIGLVLLIAIIGALKPFIQRLSGRKDQLKKQDEANDELRKQNELLAELIKKQKD